MNNIRQYTSTSILRAAAALHFTSVKVLDSTIQCYFFFFKSQLPFKNVLNFFSKQTTFHWNWVDLQCSVSFRYAAAAAKSLQSCPTLCGPIDGRPPGSPVPGILQARTLEWAAISFSNAWKWKVKVKSLSRVRLLATPWTAAHQAPPSMGFSRQEYWSGVPSPSPSGIQKSQLSLKEIKMRENLFYISPHICLFVISGILHCQVNHIYTSFSFSLKNFL